MKAGRSLQQDGVPVLESCLNMQPLQPSQMLSLWHQLARTDAWSRVTRTEPCSSSDTGSIALPEQQVGQHRARILSQAIRSCLSHLCIAALVCPTVARLAPCSQLSAELFWSKVVSYFYQQHVGWYSPKCCAGRNGKLSDLEACRGWPAGCKKWSCTVLLWHCHARDSCAPDEAACC